MIVLLQPFIGIMRQRKCVPISYMLLTIELPLVDSATDLSVYASATCSDSLIHITSTNTSYEWSVSNVQTKCLLIMLDSKLNEPFVKKDVQKDRN